MKLRIKVKPGRNTDEVIREADGSITVKIRAQPVEGKANAYLTEWLAARLDLPKSKISLLKGKTGTYKTLEIDAEETWLMKRLFE